MSARARRHRFTRVAGTTLTLLALAGSLVFVLRPRPTVVPATTSVVAAIATKSTPAHDALQAYDASPFAPSSEDPQPAPRHKASSDSENLAYDAMRASIKTRDPVLARFKALTEKVLRTTEEEDELEKLLSDKQALAREAAVLAGTDERERDPARELHRIYAVDFLAKSLAWSDNPVRSEALATVRDALRLENLANHLPEDLRRSLAADKTELYQVLRDSLPDEAQALRVELVDTHVGRLLERADRRATALARRQSEAK